MFVKYNLSLILIIWCSLVAAVMETKITSKDLLPGDLVFWKVENQDYRAGHIAVTTKTAANDKEIRIAHATDHPSYNKFTETYLQPSNKIKQHKRYYFIIRILNMQTRRLFLQTITRWLEWQIPFDAHHEKLMNQWDDSMVMYSEQIKLKLQNILFSSTPRKHSFNLNKKSTVMCSEVIILALQQAFKHTMTLPMSLKIDPILCPPSTMLFAFIEDRENFQIVGRLMVEDFTFSVAEKQAHKTHKD